MGKHEFRFWAPLVNFESDEDEIALSNKYMIRNISLTERNIISEVENHLPGISDQESFALEYSTSTEKPETEPGQKIDEIGRPSMEKAITILRLFKDELIGYKAIFLTHDEKNSAFTVRHLKHYELWNNRESGEYLIKKNEVNELKSFFKEYIKKDFSGVDLAVEYFNKSYIEPYTPRDSLIDLMISLENLYLKGQNQELGYKLAMRVAFVLGQGFEERKSILENVKEAYRLRSKIIHGEKHSKDYSGLFQTIRNYVKQSLKIFIEKPNMGDSLDDLILSGGFQKI